MKKEKTKVETLKHELRHHVPYTLTVSLLAGVIIGFFYLYGLLQNSFVEELFHFAHPLHVLFSAAAISAIYNKYTKSKILTSILIGVFGAVLIGSLSDVIFPFLAGQIFNLKTSFHLPIIEEPLIILGAGLIGASFGKFPKIFKASHNLHIFVSVLASLAYLLAFSLNLNLTSVILIAFLTFFFVYLPCCISDIFFPILVLKKPCKECGHWHEH